MLISRLLCTENAKIYLGRYLAPHWRLLQELIALYFSRFGLVNQMVCWTEKAFSASPHGDKKVYSTV